MPILVQEVAQMHHIVIQDQLVIQETITDIGWIGGQEMITITLGLEDMVKNMV